LSTCKRVRLGLEFQRIFRGDFLTVAVPHNKKIANGEISS